MGKVIGIDLGTTNSCVSIYEGGETKIIPNKEGKNTTPSIVAFTDKGEVLVGDPAKRQAITNPHKTISEVKRIMGLMMDEENAKKAHDKVTYKIVSKDGMAAVDIAGKIYTPQEISAKILSKLKEDAESYLGEKVIDAVITVPAYFNDSQRKSTKEAGIIAGLNVLRIINEPTASALAYGLDSKKDENILVFDFGGGTMDVTTLEISDGTFEVLSTDGNAFLGGADIDQKIINFLSTDFKSNHGIDLTQDKMALQRLKDAAENAKKELSSAMETEINLPFITMTNAGPQHLVVKLTRAKFESMIEDIVAETMKHVEIALKDSKLSKDQITDVIMVGGSTRIPKVQEEVSKYFNGKTLNKSVNPDEVVAAGAAIQGGVLKGEVKDILLLDVTPLSLGLETMGGIMTKLIDKGTTIPVKKSETFSTAENNQPAVSIVVCQGENQIARSNKILGQFNLDGIPPAPKGVPQIEVTFDIDANGILTVSSIEKGSGKSQSITISGSSGLSKDEIDRMVKEAEQENIKNKDKLEAIKARNELDGIIYQVEKILSENKDKLGDVSTIENKLKDAKELIKNNSENKTEIDNKRKELETTIQSLLQQVQNSADCQTGNCNTNAKKEDNEVIDAEIE